MFAGAEGKSGKPVADEACDLRRWFECMGWRPASFALAPPIHPVSPIWLALQARLDEMAKIFEYDGQDTCAAGGLAGDL